MSNMYLKEPESVIEKVFCLLSLLKYISKIENGQWFAYSYAIRCYQGIIFCFVSCTCSYQNYF